MSGFFRLQPSLIFSAVLFSGYFLALLIVFMLPVTLVAGMLCAFLLVSALLYYLCRDAWLLLSSSPVAIRVEGKEVTLLTHGGNEYQGMILCSNPGAYYFEYFIHGEKRRNTSCRHFSRHYEQGPISGVAGAAEMGCLKS